MSCTSIPANSRGALGAGRRAAEKAVHVCRHSFSRAPPRSRPSRRNHIV